MKKVFFVLVLVFSLAVVKANEPEKAPEKAKTNQIEGVVLDQKTGEALVGVCLKLKGSDIVTYTDLKGNFEIENVSPGTYDIEINYISYRDITLKSVTSATSDVNLKVELQPAAPAL